MLSVVIFATLASASNAPTSTSNNVPCQPFANLYDDGKDLCNTMFGEAFEYVPTSSPTYDLAYTMWFFTKDNPNDKTTAKRVAQGLHQGYNSTDVCWLAGETTDHKKVPSAEGDGFTECFPYKNHGCCKESTVDSSEVINNKYGPEYRWDVCGKMSSACERFMVQEACFYECDVSVGLFRQYPPMADGSTRANETGLEWMALKVPIQGDYCDAWWQACREDLFCAVGDGDVFQCSAYYEEHNPASPYSPGEIAGIVIGSLAILCLVVSVVALIRRERVGKPLFAPAGLGDPLTKNDDQQQQHSPPDQVTHI
ncbi:hypothetical protein BASA81_016255 [Batrachochytrium salamandrivorans]|nr:hypothetical protein BASA81_016255 [Batrachochytrium salamandrivorans]